MRSDPMTKEDVLAVLDAASEKLHRYCERNAQYVGGMEHSALQQKITAARATVEGLWEEREALRKERDAYKFGGIETASALRRELDDAESRATRAEAALKEAGAWRPIAEAPKDGTPFIGSDGQHAYRCEARAHYDKWPHEEGGPTYKMLICAVETDSIAPPWPPVIQWMPLPAPIPTPAQEMT